MPCLALFYTRDPKKGGVLLKKEKFATAKDARDYKKQLGPKCGWLSLEPIR